MNIRFTKPKTKSGVVGLFIKSISSEQSIVLKISKESKKYTPKECFSNVEEKIRKHGGKALYGWIIWQSDFMLEAEFHCIWISNKGKLVDITPQSDGTQEILFVSDSTKLYEGLPINNIYTPLINHKYVHEFFEHKNDLYSLDIEHAKPYSPERTYPKEKYLQFQLHSLMVNNLLEKIRDL